MKFSDILDTKELELDVALEKAKAVLDKKRGFVKQLIRQPNFNDEPRFFHYLAVMKKYHINSFNGSGCSLNEKRAKMKALGEVIERYALFNYRLTNLLFSSYEKLDKNAISPKSIVSFSENQFKTGRFEVFRVNESDIFEWVQGISIIKKKSTLVPFQLVTLGSFRDKKLIRMPISIGAACGTSIAGSSCRGIWECVERDAFMITYLNKLPRVRIYSDDPDIQYIRNTFSRYKLEVHCFDISTDIKIPVVMSIIVDRTGIGPAISIGVKCSLNIKEALVASIEEANMGRPYIRRSVITERRVRIRKQDLDDHKSRALYWKSQKMIKKLDFLLTSKEEKDISKMKKHNYDALYNLKKTRKILKRENMETIIVDLTPVTIRNLGFKVIKAIIPELQPYYMNERYKYLGGSRLYALPKILGYTNEEAKGNQLNDIPHPF